MAERLEKYKAFKLQQKLKQKFDKEDKAKQGAFHKFVSSIGNKGSRFKKTFNKGVVRYSIGGGAINIRPPAASKGGYARTGRVGRPKGSYVYRHPITGRPIHVWQYRKVVAALKRQARGTSEQVDQQQVIQMARRGIPPEQARVIINSQQIQRAMAVQQYPPQMRQVVMPQPQLTAEQAELERIRNMVPWARATAMRQLMQRNRIEQMHAQAQQPRFQTEVSLLDGKTRIKENANLRRERWTYS